MSRRRAHLPEKAGELLVPRVATAGAGQDARDVFLALAGHRFDCLQNLHVVDPGGRLLGIVPLAVLAGAAAGTRIGALMQPAQALGEHDRVVPARHRALAAPPVVDAQRRLIGCIPPQAMLALGRHAHGRDIARMAGILHREEVGAGGSHRPEGMPWRRAAARLPWLLVGLAGSALMAALMAAFEERLAVHVALAFFVPALVFLADAVGTQTEVVVIRRLSLGPGSFGPLAAGELAAGALIGCVLGGLAMPLIAMALGDWRLAAAVSLALVTASCAATACGLVFPWAMMRMGVDPAFGSGPVATVFQDGLTLLLYFAAVHAILPG